MNLWEGYEAVVGDVGRIIHGVVEEEGAEPVFGGKEVDEVFLKPGQDAT